MLLLIAWRCIRRLRPNSTHIALHHLCISKSCWGSSVDVLPAYVYMLGFKKLNCNITYIQAGYKCLLKLGPKFSKFVSSPENLTILPPKNQENHISSKTLATEIYLWTLVEASTFLATRDLTLKLILLKKRIWDSNISLSYIICNQFPNCFTLDLLFTGTTLFGNIEICRFNTKYRETNYPSMCEKLRIILTRSCTFIFISIFP